jgi:hypothetical protein
VALTDEQLRLIMFPFSMQVATAALSSDTTFPTFVLPGAVQIDSPAPAPEPLVQVATTLFLDA